MNTFYSRRLKFWARCQHCSRLASNLSFVQVHGPRDHFASLDILDLYDIANTPGSYAEWWFGVWNSCYLRSFDYSNVCRVDSCLWARQNISTTSRISVQMPASVFSTQSAPLQKGLSRFVKRFTFFDTRLSRTGACHMRNSFAVRVTNEIVGSFWKSRCPFYFLYYFRSWSCCQSIRNRLSGYPHAHVNITHVCFGLLRVGPRTKSESNATECHT